VLDACGYENTQLWTAQAGLVVPHNLPGIVDAVGAGGDGARNMDDGEEPIRVEESPRTCNTFFAPTDDLSRVVDAKRFGDRRARHTDRGIDAIGVEETEISHIVIEGPNDLPFVVNAHGCGAVYL